MKKQFAKLSKKAQQSVEAAYHDTDPREFDALMTHASPRSSNAKSHPKSKAPRKKRTQLKQQLSK